MKEMRLIGNMAQKLSAEQKIETGSLCEILECSINQYQSFLSGRLFLSFEQLEKLASSLKVTVDTLMNGDHEYYEKNIVHNMGGFENSDNREMILDIIDDYLSLKTATE